MDLSFQEIICSLIIIISIIFSIKNVMYTEDLEEAVLPILSELSTIVTFFIMMSDYEQFNILAVKISERIFLSNIRNYGLVRLLILGLIFLGIKFLVYLLFKLFNNFSLNRIIYKVNRNKFLLFLFSVIFGAIRGFIVIILICIPLVLYNGLANNLKRISVFDGLKVYDKIERIIDNKRVENISNGLKENIINNKIVYYNGVTINDGVKSNDAINKKARDITKKSVNDYEKAKDIYKWVGSNIQYDDNKAEKVTNMDGNYESGAITAFKTRKGICFDYACLYTAMSKDVGLKTRVVIGEAYNGEEYISHAWNQVYISEDDRWVNVDPTFYVSGDYFDNSNFSNDHKIKSIAGEF